MNENQTFVLRLIAKILGLILAIYFLWYHLFFVIMMMVFILLLGILFVLYLPKIKEFIDDLFNN